MWGSWRPSALILGSLTVVACAPADEVQEPVTLGRATSAITVADAVDAGCSTSQVAGLSQQIIGQANCISPGAYEELAPLPSNVTLGGAVLPYIQLPARDALLDALNANPGQSMQINSMLRTVAQQYLLYRWYQQGRCGIGLAATPGNSNHENGLAIDIQQYNTWRSDLEARGFDWLGGNDPVHFDYRGMDAVNQKGVDVLAFQQLWNINHPDDLIDADGIYGPQTQARMEQSPAEGFPMGPDCGDDPMDPPVPPSDVELTARFLDASDVYADGPSEGAVDLVEGGRYQLEVMLRHVGQSSGQAIEVDIALPEGVGLVGYSLTRDGSGIEAPVEGDTYAEPTTSLSLTVDALAVGERARLALEVEATDYTADQATPGSVVVEAEGVGERTLSLDVYSDRRFTFDGGRFEGWTGDVALDGGELVVDGEASSPSLDLRWDAVREIEVKSSGSGTVALGFDGEAPSVTLPVSDGVVATADLEGAGAQLTSIVVSGGLNLDELVVRSTETAGKTPDLMTEADGGCTVSAAGEDGSVHLAWLLGFAALARVGRRRRD